MIFACAMVGLVLFKRFLEGVALSKPQKKEFLC